MTPWSLAEERNQIKQFELIATGHSRAGNHKLAGLFIELIRITQRKIELLEQIERSQRRPESNNDKQHDDQSAPPAQAQRAHRS